MALERELAAYDRMLPSLLGDEGKYALVVGDGLVDIFFAYEDALKAGYASAGLNPFLVKKIARFEMPVYLRTTF